MWFGYSLERKIKLKHKRGKNGIFHKINDLELTEKPKGNMAIPGQKMSEKWCNKTRRFLNRVGDMSRNKSYSRGTCKIDK